MCAHAESNSQTSPVIRALSSTRGCLPRAADAMRRKFFKDETGGTDAQIEDEDFMAAAFERWAAHVKASVPAERLLVFRAKDGWEPLCAFLGVPVPSTPYPNVNEGAGFKEYLHTRWRRYAAINALCAAAAAAAAAALGAAVRRLR